MLMEQIIFVFKVIWLFSWIIGILAGPMLLIAPFIQGGIDYALKGECNEEWVYSKKRIIWSSVFSIYGIIGYLISYSIYC